MRARRTGTSSIGIGLVCIAAAVSSLQAWAKTTIIHATGINPRHPDQNFDEFYNNTNSLIEYCRAHGLKLGTDCRVFIDLSVKREKTAAPTLKASDTQGKAASADVLKQFEMSLKTAQPGDQIVLSLADHGGPGFLNPSCIFTGPEPDDHICVSDVKKVLDRWKPKGVKVFVSADGCMSGGFSELSSREVCTLVASDQHRYAGGTELWSTVVKSGRKQLNLRELRDVIRPGYDIDSLGGGFGSQVIKNRVCLREWGGASLDERNALSSMIHSEERILPTRIKEASSQNKYCGGSDISNEYTAVSNMIGVFKLIQDDELKMLKLAKTLQERHCGRPQPATTRLCSALQTYVREMQGSSYGKMTSIFSDFDRLFGQLVVRDRKYWQAVDSHAPASQVAKLQAQRGALLREYFAIRDRTMVAVQNTLKADSVQRLLSAIGTLDEELCTDEKRVHMAWQERIMSRLTLSAFRPERVPASEQALKEARECEASFVLP